MKEYTPEPRNNEASAQQTEDGKRFNRVLFAALDALEAVGIPHALMGGVAASGLGRPRSTHDIDIFVPPEYAVAALEQLEKSGFETEKRDITWLFKGWKDGVLVDIIFKSQGEIYFDEDVRKHTHMVPYHGRHVRVINPVDLVIIKCAVHSEVGPHHWYDALAILSHSQIDWDYLLMRSKKAARRLLSLLIYAQSNDILIPNRIIKHLFQTVFGDNQGEVSHTRHPERRAGSPQISGNPNQRADSATHIDSYIASHLKESLYEKLGETDITTVVEKGQIILRGDVTTDERRKAIEHLARSAAPNHQINNRINVVTISGPDTSEVVNQ